jgi:hypothetical protein
MQRLKKKEQKKLASQSIL